ncbi:MAG: hypothetical protein DYG98_27090 [Haliscomenobacteraceae bacterium CHB4]|nr:hypothetical protein [Haliscomenobacteraceae bacterium CHB4]
MKNAHFIINPTHFIQQVCYLSPVFLFYARNQGVAVRQKRELLHRVVFALVYAQQFGHCLHHFLALLHVRLQVLHHRLAQQRMQRIAALDHQRYAALVQPGYKNPEGCGVVAPRREKPQQVFPAVQFLRQHGHAAQKVLFMWLQFEHIGEEEAHVVVHGGFGAPAGEAVRARAYGVLQIAVAGETFRDVAAQLGGCVAGFARHFRHHLGQQRVPPDVGEKIFEVGAFGRVEAFGRATPVVAKQRHGVGHGQHVHGDTRHVVEFGARREQSAAAERGNSRQRIQQRGAVVEVVEYQQNVAFEPLQGILNQFETGGVVLFRRQLAQGIAQAEVSDERLVVHEILPHIRARHQKNDVAV